MKGKGYKTRKSIMYKEGYKAALLRMLPIFVMVGIVPLVIRQYIHKTYSPEFPWHPKGEYGFELFLASKAFVLTIVLIFMAIGIAIRLWKARGKVPFVKIMIPLFVYVLLTFASACTAIKKEFAFSGSYQQFETVWVLLAYVIAIYYIYLYAQTDTELQVVSDAICVCATEVGTLGALQGVGLDFMKLKFVHKLVTTDEILEQMGGSLSVNVGENQAYATLYNSNYLGVFGSFMLPFLLLMLLYEKSKWRRIWHGVNLIVVLIATISSRSRAGLIAGGIALCIALLLAARKALKWWYIVIPVINLLVVVLLLLNAYNDNIIFERMEKIFPKDPVKTTEYITEDGMVIECSGLTEMYTTDKGVVVTYNDITFFTTIEVTGFSYGVFALDENGEQIPLKADEEGTVFLFENPLLKDVKLKPVWLDEYQTIGLCLEIGKDWIFVNDDEKDCFKYVTMYGKMDDMVMAEKYGFEEYQGLFSGRGYIWSRSIPLLKEHLFLGCGPDNFLLAFPQNDYLGMYEHGYEGLVMTKPHSMYLQIGVQTGVLSLVCILVFYIWYAVQSIKLYAFRKLGTQVEAFGMAAFIGSIGYMISGISNDSMVVTAPVFWGMIGLGVAANVMVQKARKEEVKDNASENGKAKAPMKKQTGGNKKKKR